ncbi:hypothetical protein ILYODFUR_018637 [Ilyodon furcidens]|uniref:Uncharacterized protein n=1 Tax=Ilyodon furcidens TaxID=33524 RepID=A0ABV0TZG5_9TELE
MGLPLVKHIHLVHTDLLKILFNFEHTPSVFALVAPLSIFFARSTFEGTLIIAVSHMFFSYSSSSILPRLEATGSPSTGGPLSESLRGTGANQQADSLPSFIRTKSEQFPSQAWKSQTS